jgi:hypothetical protein
MKITTVQMTPTLPPSVMLLLPAKPKNFATGYHIREGIFLIYGGEPSALDQSRKQIATTKICPLILKNFNLPVPSYMPQPNSLVHA